MKDKKTYNIVLTGLFAALCCISTFIYIPAFATSGYINLGDCFVVASGLLLGPVWGAAAGGIGSMLTDIILGYAMYAPGTLVIKAGMSAVAAIIYRAMTINVLKDKQGLARFIAALCAEIIMVTGYILYEAFLLGYGYGALSGVVGNLTQAAAGIIATVPVVKIIERTKIIK